MDASIKTDKDMIVMEILPQQSVKEVNFPKNDIADLHTNYQGSSPYHVNYCGYEACKPSFLFGPNSRTSHLIHLVTKGKGSYQVEGKTYHIHAGQLFLIYPGVTTVYQADEEDPWAYYWIGFSGHQCSYILSQMGFSNQQLVIDVSDVSPLIESVQEMLSTHQLTFSNELYRTSLLLRFFAHVINQRPHPQSNAARHSGSAYAQIAMRYLSNNLDQKIRISDLADYIGIDRSYLSKSFHAEYNMSPQEYLLRLRMQKAASLLASTGNSISSIAAACGYQDALAFTKMFRERYGKSPTEYRQGMK